MGKAIAKGHRQKSQWEKLLKGETVAPLQGAAQAYHFEYLRSFLSMIDRAVVSGYRFAVTPTGWKMVYKVKGEN